MTELGDRLKAIRALADEWAKEGPALARNAHSGSDVIEGETLERCARDVLRIIDGWWL